MKWFRFRDTSNEIILKKFQFVCFWVFLKLDKLNKLQQATQRNANWNSHMKKPPEQKYERAPQGRNK